MLRSKDVLFGEIAVGYKLLTRAQLTECIELQKKAKRHKRLGHICEELGYLTRADVQRVLAQQTRLLERRAATARTGR